MSRPAARHGQNASKPSEQRAPHAAVQAALPDPRPVVRTATSSGQITSYLVEGFRLDVDARYTLQRVVGHGEYGVVCAAHDTFTNQNIAIKKISRAFDHLLDSKRTLREIRILRHFHHDNIISIKDLMRPLARDFEDVYIVSELMDTDMHQIIASNQPLNDDHFQYFIYQLLRALKYIHSANILHRDLKPSNILVNADCELKICDFGLARVLSPRADNNINPNVGPKNAAMTEYVATRWYRAPEVILANEYSKALDVWSVGCILAEFLGRKPLFPGKDHVHQINCIFEIIGSPSEADIRDVVSDKAQRYVRSLPPSPKIPLSRFFPTANPNAIDLLEKMLTFNPQTRITVEEALAHPYFRTLHDPNDEPTCDSVFSFDFEAQQLDKSDIRELIYEEILHFHPEGPHTHPLPAEPVELRTT
eukprot:gnl/Spiro4/16410_TR8815_c0_g1_i1.p1 gnl/Spiro4/16410_TR8815_c0_g1~~gnl/Spiro4/16410_TR8815_c0_g1_i1.p1  ORF type:complete len:420 (-),score=68.40 gnl/Spiro4/16410_TR8815_c0_g1_i1:66-1325(-)